ncbi:MAG: protein translocase subunit SecF, partial [Ktedonobacterales bacterium]|nr:protein translocase subunit SecF [Ktedonobacterales bacterium]
LPKGAITVPTYRRPNLAAGRRPAVALAGAGDMEFGDDETEEYPMLNLTSKKYYFFAISLIVVIFGLAAMAAWGLNPGIDFTGGTTIDLQFQNNLPASSANTISNIFKNDVKAKDVKVYYAQALKDKSQLFWVQTSIPVDQSIQAEILKRLQDQGSVLGTVQSLPPLVHASTDGGKTTYSLLPFKITPPSATSGGPAFVVTADQVQKIITAKPLPNTTVVTDATSTTTATKTPTPTVTGTPTTGTGTTNAATLPVTLKKVYAGTNNQIVTIQSQSLLNPVALQTAENSLLKQYGPLYQSQVQSVGPSIASSTTVLAVLAVLAASAAILIYIGIAFRNVGSLVRAFRYGACAIAALLHDAVVVLGVWAVLGHFFPSIFKVDTLFVTAILTVIGFSVHDTIVVFDRIRENGMRRSSESFTDVVNASLLQTMARSLNTSLTVLITLSALTIFGGEAIRPFTLALLVGIFSGTYSSIFNASMLLVVWETGEWGRKRRQVAVRPRTAPGLARTATAQ